MPIIEPLLKEETKMISAIFGILAAITIVALAAKTCYVLMERTANN